MSMHTKGPWTVIVDKGRTFSDGSIDLGGFRIDAEGVEQLCYVWNVNHRFPLEGPQSDGPKFGSHQGEADARLIAAAPELLELAKKYASECGECDGLGHVVNYVDPLERGDVSSPESLPCDFCADIRTVIAKATGATP